MNRTPSRLTFLSNFPIADSKGQLHTVMLASCSASAVNLFLHIQICPGTREDDAITLSQDATFMEGLYFALEREGVNRSTLGPTLSERGAKLMSFASTPEFERIASARGWEPASNFIGKSQLPLEA